MRVRGGGVLNPLIGVQEAAETCHMTVQTFLACVAEGFLPSSIDSSWDRDNLFDAICRLHIRPENPTPSKVYFIEVGDFIKIGFSIGVENRISAIQTSCPYEVQLLKTMPGGETEERKYHMIFAKLRHRGEWFEKSPALIGYIDWLVAA